MSEDKAVFFWPRHEVLHLITPSLCQSGRNLSNSVVLEVARQLYKVQTPDGLISYEQWLIIAKDLLKWNDWCIRLYWDMLHASIWSLLSDDSPRGHIEDFVDIGYLVVFLALHQITTHNRPSSPTKLYDSYWPSPDKEEDAAATEFMSPTGSPRSPRKKISPRPSSPKPRSPLLQIKHTRSSTYHLSSLKDRMPSILRLLSGLETGFLDVESGTLLSCRSGSFDDDLASSGYGSAIGNMEITLSRKSMAALGLALGAGFAKTTEEKLENIFPYWGPPTETPVCASGGPENFDFDFDMPATPRFPGFPQPISISTAVAVTVGKGGSARASSPPPTPPSRLAKAKSASEMDSPREPTAHSTVAVFTCSEISDWIDSRLAINESRYPVLSHKHAHGPAGGPLTSPRYDDEWVNTGPSTSPPRAGGEPDFRFGEDDGGVTPVCTYVSSADVTGWKPQVINRRQSILIYIVTPELAPQRLRSDSGASTPGGVGVPGAAGGLFGLSNLSIDGNKASLLRSTSDGSEPMTMSPRVGEDCNDADVSYEEGYDGEKGSKIIKLTKQESDPSVDYSGGVKRNLPPLYVQSCSGTNLYLLGAYSSVSVTNCIGCEIVIGAVHGVVRLVGCEKVRVTVACRKLVVVNCSDCTINVACVKPTVLVGENKALSIGPHNVNYRLLKSHLLTAGLKVLTMPAKQATNTFPSGSNSWHVFYDVGTILESPVTVNSPTGYAVDAAHTSNHPPPPTPPDAIARFLPPFSFLFLTVPISSEARGFEVGNPIEIPATYYRSLLSRRKKLTSLQKGVIDFASGTSRDTNSSLQSTLSHRFLEWLVKNGRAQQVMDLISIDENSNAPHSSR